MIFKLLSVLAVTGGLTIFAVAGFAPAHASAKTPSLIAKGAAAVSTSPYADCVAKNGTPDECADAFGPK